MWRDDNACGGADQRSCERYRVPPTGSDTVRPVRAAVRGNSGWTTLVVDVDRRRAAAGEERRPPGGGAAPGAGVGLPGERKIRAPSGLHRADREVGELPDTVRVGLGDLPSQATVLHDSGEVASATADPEAAGAVIIVHSRGHCRAAASGKATDVRTSTGSRSAPYMHPTRAGAAVATVG